jgi:hypothetical protein
MADIIILNDIKKSLGISVDYDAFDSSIVPLINSNIMSLTQLGIGPEEGFVISEDGDETWFDFIGDRIDIEAIKSYIYLNVKLVFDPPSSSFVINAIKDQIQEFVWRLNVQAGGD